MDTMSVMRTLVAVALSAIALAQPPAANYDEAKIAKYTLPDPLVFADGKPVRDARAWRQRRAELVRLFESNIFGRSPERPKSVVSEVLAVNQTALGGKAIRKQVRVWLDGTKDGRRMDLLVYLPAKATGKVPVLVGLNFGGNHTVTTEADVPITESWVANSANSVNNRATEKSRGIQASRWPIAQILDRGYGVATAYYGDIEPDFNGGIDQSIRKNYLKDRKPAADEWGAVAAWAWGLSRAMDYLEKDPKVDAKRVAVIGHSRLGKAAVWAGASDTRFAAVISNDSGEGGAALSRRWFGETVKDLNTRFPHWFAANYSRFNDKEADLPVDMHELLALIAPRPVYVASAQEDQWADPLGEFLSAKAASPVYKLLTGEGLAAEEMPAIHQPVMSRIGYHIRGGKHDITEYDWARFMDWADKWMK